MTLLFTNSTLEQWLSYHLGCGYVSLQLCYTDTDTPHCWRIRATKVCSINISYQKNTVLTTENRGCKIGFLEPSWHLLMSFCNKKKNWFIQRSCKLLTSYWTDPFCLIIRCSSNYFQVYELFSIFAVFCCLSHADFGSYKFTVHFDY